jgi:HlyD family secretion protein
MVPDRPKPFPEEGDRSVASSTDPARRRPRRRWLWVTLVVLVLSIIGAGVFASRQNGRKKGGVSTDDIDLRIGKAEIADIQITVNEVGTIEPLVKVDVKSNLSGKIIDLLVREGDRVFKGKVLARVEPDVNQAQTLSQVRSAISLAEIEAEDARRDLETNTRLHQEGFVSNEQLKNFKVRFDTATENLGAARTKARIVEESGIPLDGQISTTQRVNIVSPMDGHVIKKNVEVGQTVTSGVSSFNEGTALYTVADVRSMLIKASINEVDIGKVRLGMPVVITVDAFPYRRFDGTVTHISPAARLNEKVKVFDIEVGLKEQVPDFRVGMTANIEARGEKVEKTLAVPVEAIFSKNDRDIVYVLKEKLDPAREGEKKPRKTKSGKYDISDAWQRYFEERPVKVGLVSLEKAQVLEGLAEGVQVALENPTRPRQIDEE